MARKPRGRPDDADVEAVREAIEAFKTTHPRAEVETYRQNSASIRVRIIDPDFKPLDRGERHDLAWALVENLPYDILSQISILLLLTPQEAKTSFMNMDFENPIPSRL